MNPLPPVTVAGGIIFFRHANLSDMLSSRGSKKKSASGGKILDNLNEPAFGRPKIPDNLNEDPKKIRPPPEFAMSDPGVGGFFYSDMQTCPTCLYHGLMLCHFLADFGLDNNTV